MSGMEYAVLISAIATALTGGGSIATLPSTAAQATASVATVARSARVSTPGARKALARAPYRRPELRYLYAVGWVMGTKSRQWCHLFVTAGLSSEKVMRDGLRRARGMSAALRRAKIPERVAVRAADAGFRSACA